MKLEEVKKIVEQLAPQERRILADGIYRQLHQDARSPESPDTRRERRLAAIARCDEHFGGPGGEGDSAELLRKIRDHRMADIL